MDGEGDDRARHVRERTDIERLRIRRQNAGVSRYLKLGAFGLGGVMLGFGLVDGLWDSLPYLDAYQALLTGGGLVAVSLGNGGKGDVAKALG